MEKLTQLYIRACKSKNPSKRLVSLHRRYYLTNEEPEAVYASIAGVLSCICEDAQLHTTSDLVNDLAPGNRWRFGLTKDSSYTTVCMHIFVSKIRLSEVSKFPGLTTPRRFR